MCPLKRAEEKAIPLIIKGNDFRLYEKSKHRVESYEEGIRLLISWYKSEEKQTPLLSQWSRIQLTEAFAKIPDLSEIDVFKTSRIT